MNDSIVLPPPPGENSFSFQKSKSQPVSLDTIEDLLNTPAEPIRLENNRFIEPCTVSNTRNALLNPVEFSQRKQISLANINVCRKQSFSELYKEYKRTKETASQNIKQHTKDFSQRVNKETPKDVSSQEKLIGQTFKNVSFENYISQEVKLNNKLNNWIDSLMKSPSLVRSKTAISKQEISIEKELSFRKSVSVNLQVTFLEEKNNLIYRRIKNI